MNETEKEIKQLQKRLSELADKSFNQNMYTFTGFLGLSDQAVFCDMEKELAYAGAQLFGGNPDCERKMLRFGKEENLGYVEKFPITLLIVRPLLQKFADQLSHRDFLGAIMNLGIERSTVGDILIRNNTGYVYCQSKVADYLIENLDKIKHTNVTCAVAREEDVPKPPEPVSMEITVSSVRIDGVISKIYNLSRTQSLELFRAGKIYLNGRLCENNSCYLKENDAITVRGFGKFIYQGTKRETRKGKLSVGILIFGRNL